MGGGDGDGYAFLPVLYSKADERYSHIFKQSIDAVFVA